MAGVITLYFVMAPPAPPKKEVPVKLAVQREVPLEKDSLTATNYLAEAIITAAQRNPNHSLEWDELIRDLAHRYPVTLKMERRDDEMSRMARDATARGCKDPFVRYLAFKYLNECTDLADDARARSGLAIVEEMKEGSYPPLLCGFAAKRAYAVWRDAYGFKSEVAVAKLLSQRLWDTTFDSVRDPSIPEWMNRSLAQVLESIWQGSKTDREYVAGQLEAEFLKRYGDCATIHDLRGLEKKRSAWDARGGGYAGTVTKEGWKIFNADLTSAREEFELAWKLDPNDAEAAGSMIPVCMGLGLPREEMERWFERGLATGQDASVMCDDKLLYLAPRWHGSVEEQLQFARECLAHPHYGWRAVLMLWHAHVDNRSIGEKPLSFYGQPEVWADIKLSLSTYLESNPDAGYMRMHYCYHAWLAKDWPALHEQLKLFDPTQVSFRTIGGKTVYDQIVADDQLHQVGS